MNKLSLSRLISLAVIVVLLATGNILGAQAQDDNECNFEGDAIRVGVTGPLSAPGAVRAGIDMQWAFNIAEADINADCGIEIEGVQYPIEVIFGDTEGLPERGVAVAERLINENNVVALAGEYHSAVGLAMMDVTAETNTPTVYAETWSDSITAQGYQNVFRIAPTSTMASSVDTAWLIAQGVENVVLIAENTDFGIGGAEAAQALLEAADVKVEVIFVELGTEDFVPILSRIQASGAPDAVSAALVTGETSYNLVQQMADLGLAPTADTICIANQVAIAPEFWDAVPDGNYCAFRKVGIRPAEYNEIAQSIAERYRDDFDSEPPSWVFESYDSLFIVADAIERAGTTDPDAVVAALETTDITLAQGDYYFEYTADNPVPDDVPAWMWHQWPDPAVLMLQYTEQGQAGVDAPVIWPLAYQTQEYTTPE